MTTSPPPTETPDVRQLRAENLPEGAFPGGRGQDFRIHFEPEVHRALWRHALEDTSVEICGVLVGRLGRDADGPFVTVSESIRGEAAENKFAEVTFTHQTWAKINDEMDRKFADLAIVGWYHTHPDFGIFLSDRDVFIHQHFFTGPGQIALVLDPIRRTEGVFIWTNGKPSLAPHCWVGNELTLSTPAGSEAGRFPTAMSATAAAPSASPTAPQPASPSGLSLLERTLIYVALFLLGWVLNGYRSTWEQTRLAEGVVSHFGLWQGLRPGLEGELDSLNTELAKISNRVDTLAGDHLERLGKDKAAESLRSDWRAVRHDLAHAVSRVSEIRTLYGMSPYEAEATRQFLEKLRILNAPERRDAPPPGRAPTPPRSLDKEAPTGTTKPPSASTP